MKRHSRKSIVFLAVVLLIMYLPIITVVVYSFNDNPDRNPIRFTGWTTEWYNQLFAGTRGYGDALGVSLTVAAYSVLISTVIGTMGAVGMAQKAMITRKTNRLESAMELLVTLPIMIPEIILAMALMTIFYACNLPFGNLTLVLAHTTFCIPYIFLMVKSRLVGMDDSLFDAARDLGASPGRVLFDITLPLCRPAIISGMFLAFAMSMDDFVISFFVYGSDAVTLPVKVYSSVKLGVSPQINALCTLMIAAAFTAVAVSQYVQSMRTARNRVIRRA
ncbi:MAG: ABC transporter permease [Clostridia bacterium]|nr:ABC transporter permease [Clostridia bacterium]